MPIFKIRTTYIDYCIEYEDVCDYVKEEEVNNEIERIKSSLPQHLEFEIECNEDDLDYIIYNAISNKTGWLINSFKYEQI